MSILLRCISNGVIWKPTTSPNIDRAIIERNTIGNKMQFNCHLIKEGRKITLTFNIAMDGDEFILAHTESCKTKKAGYAIAAERILEIEADTERIKRLWLESSCLERRTAIFQCNPTTYDWEWVCTSLARYPELVIRNGNFKHRFYSIIDGKWTWRQTHHIGIWKPPVKCKPTPELRVIEQIISECMEGSKEAMDIYEWRIFQQKNYQM